MDYEDRITIATPEGVNLELVLAGLGSRFAASVLDALVRVGIIFAVNILITAVVEIVGETAVTSSFLLGFTIALVIIFYFLVIFGYDVLFEVLASGRTPGKRALGLRVVRLGGYPVGFIASAIRNILRLVDFLPVLYTAGTVSMIATSRNQRLGDLAAGTLVIRERFGVVPSFVPRAAADPSHASWDVTAITPDELAAARRFLDRRYEIMPEARGRLAWELTERLKQKVAGAPQGLHPETFLESLVATKSSRV